MVYTDLENLKGLIKPTDYGSGVEFADGILNSLFPNIDVGLQVSEVGLRIYVVRFTSNN